MYFVHVAHGRDRQWYKDIIKLEIGLNCVYFKHHPLALVNYFQACFVTMQISDYFVI